VRLVFVTQVIDADDRHLEITIDLVRALAARFDEVEVLCDRVRRHDLPGNVRFRTFGSRTRVGRGLRFAAGLAGALARGRPDAVLAHMVPVYAVLAAPLLLPLRVPLVLWYTHWHASRMLWLATRLSTAVLSVDRRSFPLATEKVHAIGHAIDVARFAPRREDRAPNGLRFLALGRTERRKRLPELLTAFERAAAGGLDATLEIRGPQITAAERDHRRELEESVAASPLLRERVVVAEPVPRERIPELLGGADALVNLTRGETHGGALDKVVYEAAACAVPVIACNPHLDGLLAGLPVELRFRGGDPDDLARVLLGFAASDPGVRAEAGRELRRRVEAGHSVDTWADGVLRVVSGLDRRGRPLDS
jgi:glycosyltransferase involved in cell wall biosynthesis